MMRISEALDTPPVLLETVDLEPAALDALAGGKAFRGLPEGFVRLCAVLPEHQAYIVRRWDEATRKRIREIESH
jgi:hypothetical protein